MNYKRLRSLMAIFVVLLMFNLPLVTSIQISNVRVTDITSHSANVQWDTDEASDSFVSYGLEKDNLRQIGDARQVTSHSLPLENLNAEQQYFYSVESSSLVDDNSGELYTFSTPEVDVTPPILEVEFPETLAGTTLELSGDSEAGATISVSDNGQAKGSVSVNEEGKFQISVSLSEIEDHTIIVTATDSSDNTVSKEAQIKVDSKRPVITLEALPKIATDRSLTINGTLSEESQYEIFVNNRSVAKDAGLVIDKTVTLKEGENQIRIVAIDNAGFETVAEFEITADLERQFITSEIERGQEYYENSANSAISGTTKPGSKVYLYVFKPTGFEYTPDFSKAREVVTADEKGEFRFDDVNFAREITDLSLEDLAPKEVPSGLQEITLFSRAGENQQQQFTYQVYLISEDDLGRAAFSDHTIRVNSCSSGDFGFAIQSVPRFQAPLRLVPQLLDDGRQEIQAVFDLQYQGSGVGGDPRTATGYTPQYTSGNFGRGGVGAGLGSYRNTAAQNQIDTEQGFRVTSIRFNKACTQSLANDDKYGVGCRILPNSPQVVRNNDGTKYYVTWKLAATKSFSKAEDDFWNEFKNRQLNFPLKVEVNYQEREGDNKWSTPKIQSSCYNLGYQVDIPIDSKNLIPDFLANEGVDALNWTITQLQTVRPILEKVYIVTAAVAMGTFLLRLAARWSRIVTSKSEAYFSVIKPKLAADKAGETFDEAGKCPADQTKLYLQDTIKNWCNLIGKNKYATNIPEVVAINCNNPEALKEHTLEERCPSTASAWKLESSLNTAYRWTWDRSFCRAVPASWTSSERLDQIGTSILKQQQCAVTGRGVPLTRRENCQELVRTQIINTAVVKKDSVTSAVSQVQAKTGGVCWQDAEGTLYYNKPDSQDPIATKNGIWKLTPVGSILQDIKSEKDVLIAYKPQGSSDFIVGRDVACQDVCRSNSGKEQYSYVEDSGEYKNGCFDEEIVGGKTILRRGDQKIPENSYSGGYTKDCFIKGYDPDDSKTARDIVKDNNPPQFQQCVCRGTQGDKTIYEDSSDANFIRTAIPEDEGNAESFSYRQDRVFRESKQSIGTYYPEIRYYSGRDVSGAFGANYLIDYISTSGDNSDKLHEVNPHTQLIGRWQSVCMSGILKDIKLLENILTGMRNCLVSAKFTGLQDAGACKTLFTQHVCGLLYKGIAYLNNQCSPITIEDEVNEGNIFGDAGQVIKEGFAAIPKALDSSIADVLEDYGNAKLNEYFRAGAQGFAQSMCLYAFGVEFPLFSTDFLLDAAYSFPTKSTVLLGPRERELSTFNPAKQTAVFNYNIGGIILPGCNIRNWKISLKCIGPEDRKFPGVDTSCGGEGCDCLNAQGLSNTGGGRERLLMSDSNLKSGDLFSIPLESPQRIDSVYRYDHVKVELFLDPNEKSPESCFEDGYWDGSKGVYYEPLVDTSPPAQFSCTANLLTGQFRCPEIGELFGFGGTYLEEPFISCWNKETNTWTSCDAPNLYVIGDQIRVGVHLNQDSKAACLKRTVSPPLAGVQTNPPYIIPLQANTPGQLIVPNVLTTVDGSMFGATRSGLQSDENDNRACTFNFKDQTADVESASYRITFFDKGNGNYEVELPSDVRPRNTNYGVSGNKLTFQDNPSLSITNINRAELAMGGLVIDNIIGNENDFRADLANNKNYCQYRIGATRLSSQQLNTRKVTVQFQLLEADESGSCFNAHRPIKSNLGRPSASRQITIQKEAVASLQNTGIKEQFNRQNYRQVLLSVNDVLNQRRGNLANIMAIYYGTASVILLAEAEKGQGEGRYDREIDNFLSLFFRRESGVLLLDPIEVSGNEFEKIKKYMCEIDQKYGGNYQNEC
jgi:hypothetical protein